MWDVVGTDNLFRLADRMTCVCGGEMSKEMEGKW